MLKVLERKDWVAEVEKVRPLLLNEEETVVAALCKGNKLTPIYFLYQKKNKTLISFIALTTGKAIKHPFHFFYSAFWIDGDLSDTQYCQCTAEFVKLLLTNYNKITIKLPLSITDIRPFLWTGFSITNYYTYIKQLSDLSYHPVTEKNIKKAKNGGYECKQEELSAESLALNLKLFEDLKVYTSNQIVAFRNLMLSMQEGGYITSFNCYESDKLIASNIVFLDVKNKIAYTVLLNKVARTNKDDVHSLLHDFFFMKLKADGYNCVDLLGGDMQGIAPFKSRFKSQLAPHFMVSYSQNSVLFGRVRNVLKSTIKKWRAKLS